MNAKPQTVSEFVEKTFENKDTSSALELKWMRFLNVAAAGYAGEPQQRFLNSSFDPSCLSSKPEKVVLRRDLNGCTEITTDKDSYFFGGRDEAK